MKNFAKLLLASAVVTFAVACNNNASADKTSAAGDITNTLTTRGAKKIKAAERFSAAELNVKFEQLETIVMQKASAAAAADDAATIANLFGNLQTAQNAQALNVKFSMSDAPVEDGIFVFAIESDEDKKLLMEMYDEEGFEMSAQNNLNVTTGNNYKALNVKEMDNGNYVFRLKDEEGRELVRSLSIQNE